MGGDYMKPFDVTSFAIGYASGQKAAEQAEKNSQRSHQGDTSAQDPEQHQSDQTDGDT